MKRLKKFFAALAIIMIIASPVLVFADADDIIPDNNLGLPGQDDTDLESLIIQVIMEWLLPFAGIIAVLFIIIGGFQYMLSGANEDLAKRGKTTLRNAIIGLIIVVLSYVIISVVVNTLFKVAG